MRILSALVLLLLTLFTAAIFAMPPVIAILFGVLCLWLFVRKKRGELAMMLASLLFVFGCIEIYVRFNADDIFYREHERYALKQRYRTHIAALLNARFGDIVAMDGSLKDKLAEPRAIAFKTDRDGYRNNADYTNEPYVIVGDSFATTIGNTQDDILVSQLNRAMPGQFYSRAFPGLPKDYENHAILFSEDHPNARYVWFMYEGNDFFMKGEGAEGPRRPGMRERTRDYRSLHILPFLTTRMMTLLQRTAKAAWSQRKKERLPPEVELYDLAGKPVGFFKKYIDHAVADELTLSMLGTPEIMERTACVFFIPDKYRVYRPWMKKDTKWDKEAPQVSEPAAAMAALNAFFGPRNIPVVDLTPPLQKAASNALKDGKFVFWRDDTHWNAAGIASIVPAVKACVDKDKTR